MERTMILDGVNGAILEAEKREKDVKKEKDRILDKVSDALLDIEKIKFALGTLLGDYNFSERLNPVEGYKYGSTVPGERNEVGENSFYWVLDHRKIMTFLEISHDYLLKTDEKLKSIIEE